MLSLVNYSIFLGQNVLLVPVKLANLDFNHCQKNSHILSL
jgi:hypothetical protein